MNRSKASCSAPGPTPRTLGPGWPATYPRAAPRTLRSGWPEESNGQPKVYFSVIRRVKDFFSLATFLLPRTRQTAGGCPAWPIYDMWVRLQMCYTRPSVFSGEEFPPPANREIVRAAARASVKKFRSGGCPRWSVVPIGLSVKPTSFSGAAGKSSAVESGRRSWIFWIQIRHSCA